MHTHAQPNCTNACTCTMTHTCARTHTHTRTHANATHARAHTRTNTRTNTRTRTRCPRTRAHTQQCESPPLQNQTHTCTHTHVRARACPRTHTCLHTNVPQNADIAFPLAPMHTFTPMQDAATNAITKTKRDHQAAYHQHVATRSKARRCPHALTQTYRLRVGKWGEWRHASTPT